MSAIPWETAPPKRPDREGRGAAPGGEVMQVHSLLLQDRLPALHARGEERSLGVAGGQVGGDGRGAQAGGIFYRE